MQTFHIVQQDDKKRLDVFLSKHVDLSRSQIKRTWEQGGVLINNESPKKIGMLLSSNDVVCITLPQAADITAVDKPIRILYQDDDVIISDKPAGLVTHPDHSHINDSMLQRVLQKTKVSSIGAPLRPGIVHRLDKDTSGVIIIAKNDAAYYHLVEQFKSRATTKTYLALVWGTDMPEKGTIESPIGRDAKNPLQMSIAHEGSGREAITHFNVRKRYAKQTLLEVRIETGRTHQIRVHMQSIGHPVVNDVIYGDKQRDAEWQVLHAALAMPPLFLHAHQLGIVLPNGDKKTSTSEIPESWRVYV